MLNNTNPNLIPQAGAPNPQMAIQAFQGAQLQQQQQAEAAKQQKQQALLSALQGMAALRMKNKWPTKAHVIHPTTGAVMTQPMQPYADVDPTLAATNPLPFFE